MCIMKLTLEELLQPREYDFRVSPSGATAPDMLPHFRDRFWKALHSSPMPAEKVYTTQRIQKAVQLTGRLHTVAAFCGGRLLCDTRQKTMYRCVLLLATPLVFLQNEGKTDRIAVLLHNAVQLSEQFFLDVTDDGWLKMQFYLDLTDTPDTAFR